MTNGEVTSYQPFDLLIERREEGLYLARLLRAPAGEDARVSFANPLSTANLDDFIASAGMVRRGLRYVEPAVGELASTLGGELFGAVFGGEVGLRLQVSLGQVRATGEGLRLQLRLGHVPELARLPWELLYDRRCGGFLALRPSTPLVRYLELPTRIRPLRVRPPIHVLVASANPEGFPRLEVEQECLQIRDALAELEAQGRIVLDLLPGASIQALRERLRRGPCHVLHFIGHGVVDEPEGAGALLLEGERGQARRVTGRKLGLLLDHPDLRLVVINACHGGRSSPRDALAGVAQSLVWEGIPAVVAMQFPVSDRGAITFARHFYTHLAGGLPVDAAVARGREAIYLDSEEESVEWAAPVIFTRSPDGHLFEFRPGGRKGVWFALVSLLLALVLTAYLSYDFSNATSDPGRSLRPPTAAASHPRCPPPPGIQMEMVLIEPGTFPMGSTRREDEAEPVHTVTLTRPYCLSAHEVTQSQWEAVLGADGHQSAFPGPDRPVEKVTWDEARRYVDELSRLAGSPVFRLPTEAEWEYAARAGRETAYSFGEDLVELPRHGNCRSRAGGDDGFDGTAPVGSFEPNAWGLYDMHGNVWEWVADFHAPYEEGAATDPTGPAAGERRARRGGSFDNRPELCRSATRKASGPGSRSREVGFRMVREALPEGGTSPETGPT